MIKRENEHSNSKINNQNVCAFGSIPLFFFKQSNAKINSQTQNKQSKRLYGFAYLMLGWSMATWFSLCCDAILYFCVVHYRHTVYLYY